MVKQFSSWLQLETVEKQVSRSAINFIVHMAVPGLDFRSSKEDRELHRLHRSGLLSDSALMKKQIHCDRGQWKLGRLQNMLFYPNLKLKSWHFPSCLVVQVLKTDKLQFSN